MRTKNPTIRPFVSMVLFILVILFFRPGPGGCAAVVHTDKEIYPPGEKVKVHFSNAPGDGSDWICIVPFGAADTEAGDYQYMPRGLSQGVLTFDAPSPGKYEVRAYYNYRRNGYVVSARYPFSVVDRLPAEGSAIPPPAPPRSGSGQAVAVEKPLATAFGRGASRYSVAVFHFKPVNMDASHYGITVTNTLLNAPKMQSAFAMVDRKDLETFLVANDLQQNDQVENAIDIGRRLGLNFVIAGSVEKRGTMIVTNYKVVGIEQQKAVFTNRSISMGESDLVGNVIKMSDAIIETILLSRF